MLRNSSSVSPLYTPLFIHSSYSLLSSTIRIDRLIDHAANLGFTSIALTDSHNLFGAMEFSLACAKRKIKPIIGAKVKIEGKNELLLYCKNQIGYENLCRLISDSYTNNCHTSNYDIKWSSLPEHSEGLIAIATPSLLSFEKLEDLRYYTEQLNHHSTWSKMEWYVGLEPNQHYYNESAYMSQIFDTPVAGLSETYFLHKSDQEAHDVLLCIKNKNYILDPNRVKSNERFCLMDPEEMQNAFKGSEFAVENTNRIAARCNFSLQVAAPKLPRFKTPETDQRRVSKTKSPETNEGTAANEIDELTRIAQNGLRDMQIPENLSSEYQKRLDFELQVINNMGFPGYFLIVSDFVRFARNNNIPVSIRGSGAGSLVARCINITEIDPIKFELFFERFLNPGRISMPDFDIDFSPNGREITINYVLQKYGKECVSGIITFGTLSSRAVLKDVGRVLQVPYSKIDNLSKRIQVLFGRPFTLIETYERDKEFAELIDSDESLTKTFEIAKQLEGLYRHVSAHAAGIIITDRPIYKIAPLYQDDHSQLPLVQFSMKYAELAGLVKFDFLGVTALDIIADTIKEIRNAGHVVDLSDTEFDDKDTFAFLRMGHTKGVFQFETAGMTKLIHSLEADCIEDLIATVALYRPGPMDNIPMFIRCKKGQEKIHYIYPDLENILSNTHGIIVYQEQILRIVQEIAGYSLSEADLLRRVIGKKIPQEMAKHKEDFIKRAHQIQGGDITKADELFKLIETFANYGFNKAHAAAYAIVGYRGAYLKTHYPLYFICVSMTAEQHNTEKTVELVLEARNLSINVLKPCINNSSAQFMVQNGTQDKTILYSLAAIKNIGTQLANKIFTERPFKSVKHLIDTVHLNKREIESLIRAGALDCINPNRSVLSQIAAICLDKEHSLLFDPLLFVDETQSWSREDSLRLQKEVLGIYLDGHPLNAYQIKNLGSRSISEFDINEDRDMIETACILDSYKQKFGKKNNKYLLCACSDIEGSWSGIVTDEYLINQLPNFKNKEIWCKVQIRNGRILFKSIEEIKDKISSVKDIHIKIQDETALYKLSDLFNEFRSEDGVGIYVHTDDVMFIGHVDRVTEFIANLEAYQWYAKY